MLEEYKHKNKSVKNTDMSDRHDTIQQFFPKSFWTK